MSIRRSVLKALRDLAVPLASTAGAWLLFALGRTMRFRVRGLDFIRAGTGVPEPTIYAFWHDRLLTMTVFGPGRTSGHAALISRHPDADAIARAASRLGIVPVRGSSSRGGLEALGQLARHLREGRSVVFTPDGPRGPRHRAGEGVIVLAQRAKARIVPLGCAVRPRILIGSWDRLQVPLPFSRAAVVEGEALRVPPDSGGPKRSRLREELERRLADLTARAEAVAAGREDT